MQAHERIILALDVPSAAEALQWVRRFRGRVGLFKVGLELVHAAGLGIIDQLHREGMRVFYDAKLHDIPNTVAGAVRQAVQRQLAMLNVHCLGGAEMMRAAVEAKGSAGTMLLGVTLLTSIGPEVLTGELQVPVAPKDYVVHLARLAQQAGLDGVVASPQEVRALRQACGPGFVLVTPGVRPAGAEVGDQCRVLTPGEALRAGADYLVIGRPILKAADPEQAWTELVAEMEAAGERDRTPTSPRV